jgi:cytochrome c2
MKKVIFSVLIVLFVGIIGFLSYVKMALPNVGDPENIKADQTPENIERGKYLANSVCVCMDCHSERDWTKYSGPLKPGTLGMGGEEFSQKLGFPGKYYAKNITPFALKDWTDGEILRAIASGVNKSGKALFPVMPHPNYGKLDKKDLFAIIAYLRSIPSVESKIPESESDFPMNFIINMIPQKAMYSNIPDTSDQVAYGKYLYTAASCTDCHTRQENGKPVEGMELAGGFKFPLISGGFVFSANITPDKETGIGNWSEETFVNRFKAYADTAYTPSAVNKGDFNTMMPWMMYSTMKTGDLKAIFAYLKTVKPVKNNVTKFMAEDNKQ